ncbi:purine-cytosine permease family protein [Gluconobacter kanchanaburiensis]|uniref:Allantoin permease n=1 Tax=Gluconobacter kanchanaburiensis NBRC 103587 TaxID=1307948 RepID=A0A511B6V0_9PROT|nr:cytosine permease [Gluconobacter kanchanaburiensis]MBF0861732.1 cytosine permease [Gluconobacter kanchanaburiensis]GBR67330.1 cytosine/purines/uracil/thiamine/allantoin transporter [Gluconobacter kanchanaburiensis NBRC 103587]GEK95381.1 allantoin permease [Gluconobacter kanchanaburiensis NBRC 103587]
MVDAVSTLESETIYPIPAERRHGTARDLFTVWFGPNLMMLTVATGALATTVFGLSLIPAILSLLLGNLVGGVFMALHAAQGPRLGVPQMIQTRGQFGLFGAVPITAIIVLMYVGFVASNLVLGAEGVQACIPGLGRFPAIVIIQLLSVLPAVMGYHVIHAAARILSLLCGIAVLVCFVALMLPHPAMHVDAAHWGSGTGILRTVSLAALWQIAYAPYVSDSSRYLPAGGKNEKNAFIACFSGSVSGSFLAMGLGAAVGTLVGGQHVVAVLTSLLGVATVPVMLALSLGIAVANAMNVYCGALSTLTVAQTFTPDHHYGRGARLVVTIALLLFAFGMATLMADRFMTAYSEFLELLMSIMIPWTAINLTDYYILHHGEYDVASFFRRDGGRYGYWNIPALGCYVAGILFQVPFLSTALYTGSLAKMLGGVDISWVVSLALTPPLYIFMERRFRASALPGGERA